MRSILPILALLALTAPAQTFDFGTTPGSPGASTLNSHDDPCEVPCYPPWAQLENEPPLVDGYVDAHNGDCNSPGFGNPFQYLEQGWFPALPGLTATCCAVSLSTHGGSR